MEGIYAECDHRGHDGHNGQAYKQFNDCEAKTGRTRSERRAVDDRRVRGMVTHTTCSRFHHIAAGVLLHQGSFQDQPHQELV